MNTQVKAVVASVGLRIFRVDGWSDKDCVESLLAQSTVRLDRIDGYTAVDWTDHITLALIINGFKVEHELSSSTENWQALADLDQALAKLGAQP